MISVFNGEFLTNPIPLEVQLHPCNYGCAYCFATLNYRHSRYTRCNVASLFNLLTELPRRKTLAAHLLRSGYPVCLSNHTDPFCPRNRDLTRQLLTAFQALKIPVLLQTKGGVPEDVFDLLRPSVWYLTITTDREDIRARYEPHAPTIADRFALIKRLVSLGHIVTIGLNPFVPEWWRDLLATLEEWQALGVHGVWAQHLHFHYRQRDHMTPAERAAIGDALLTRAMQRKKPPEVVAAFSQLEEMALESGLEFYHVGQWRESRYFEAYRRVYPRLYPTMQDFLNWCYASMLSPVDYITEREWLNVMTPHLPTGKWNEVSQVLGSTNHDLYWHHAIPSKLSYAELLSILWRNPAIKKSPLQSACLTMLGQQRQEKFATYLEDGAPLLAFHAQAMKSPFQHLSEEEMWGYSLIKHPDWMDDETRAVFAEAECNAIADATARLANPGQSDRQQSSF